MLLMFWTELASIEMVIKVLKQTVGEKWDFGAWVWVKADGEAGSGCC